LAAAAVIAGAVAKSSSSVRRRGIGRGSSGATGVEAAPGAREPASGTISELPRTSLDSVSNLARTIPVLRIATAASREVILRRLGPAVEPGGDVSPYGARGDPWSLCPQAEGRPDDSWGVLCLSGRLAAPGNSASPHFPQRASARIDSPETLLRVPHEKHRNTSDTPVPYANSARSLCSSTGNCSSAVAARANPPAVSFASSAPGRWW
jgi:hypothetical protein